MWYVKNARDILHLEVRASGLCNLGDCKDKALSKDMKMIYAENRWINNASTIDSIELLKID